MTGIAVAFPATTVGEQSPGHHRVLVSVLVFLGMVVAVVSSLGAPLVPTIAIDYGVSLSNAQWSLTITLLAGAIFTPVLGRLGDGPRRRTVILGAMGLLVAGSVLAALPASFAFLLVGRALQGVGLGLTPLAMAVARDHLPAEKSRSAVATLSITTVAGVGLGYPLTALIAQHLGLHAAFWAAAGAGTVVLACAALVIPTSSHRAHRKLDAWGAVLLGVGLAALLVAVSKGAQWGWSSTQLLGAAGIAVLSLSAWVWRELHIPQPLVDLRLLRNRSVLTADVTGLVAGVGMYFLMSMVILFVQTPTSTGYGLGASVVVGALVLVPFSAASVAANKLSPIISRRLGPNLVIPAGAIAFLVAMLMFLFARHNLWQILIVMTLGGLGVGCTFAAMPAFIVRAVPSHETGSALGVNQVLKVVGGSLGSALTAGILTAHTPPNTHFATNSGYTVAAVVGVGIWLLAAVLGLVLPERDKGNDAPEPAESHLLVQESVDASAAAVALYEPDDEDER
ncbi:MAG: MFS transporter [Mycobacteriaceae bacterium]